MNEANTHATRRAFMRFLAASPVLAAASRAMGQPAFDILDPYAPQVITRAQDAINVFDFEATAKVKFQPGHYTYMSQGAGSGGTVQANRDGFKKFQIRARRLVNTSNLDTGIELFGTRYSMPIMIAPCGAQNSFHHDGELHTARAARSRDIRMILSNGTSNAVEQVNSAYGRPVWFQLYVDESWQTTEAIIKRAERAGCPALVVTVDSLLPNREVSMRHRRSTNPDCQGCHAPDANVIRPKPMYEGLIRTDSRGRPFLDWDFVDRIRDLTSLKVIIKGIVTAEDAELVVEHGFDGLIVSNHGGRVEDSGRSTIESLPEVVAAVNRRIPVLLDSGVRRGTDIFKALALGADAVAIGRPYLWGLGCFGQEGVEVVLDILKRELESIMSQAGARRIADINNGHVT